MFSSVLVINNWLGDKKVSFQSKRRSYANPHRSKRCKRRFFQIKTSPPSDAQESFTQINHTKNRDDPIQATRTQAHIKNG